VRGIGSGGFARAVGQSGGNAQHGQFLQRIAT